MSDTEVQYTSIPANHVKLLESSPCDVYIRIVKAEGDDRYLKRIFAGDNFTPQEIQTYMEQRGVTKFYVEKNFHQEFDKHLKSNVTDRLVDPKANSRKTMEATQAASEIIFEEVRAGKITEELVAMSEQTMRNTVKTGASYKKLNGMLKDLLKNKSSYQFKHVQLLTGLTVDIMKNIDWGNEKQVDNMAFTCLFHDISLTEDDHCKIRSNKELFKSSYSEEIKDLIKKHAQKSVELIHNYPKIPMGCDLIIKQHHGNLNGLGFAETFGANVSPASRVFIVAEELVDELIEQGVHFDPQECLQGLRGKFTGSKFKKVIDTIEKLDVLG